MHGSFELTGKEICRLKLDGKLRVNWYPSDTIPINGRDSFYYLEDRIREPLDLIHVPPAGLIVRQIETMNGEKKNYHINFEGLPSDFFKKSKFSHYYIGQCFSENSKREIYVRKGSDLIGSIIEVAPIVFLNKK